MSCASFFWTISIALNILRLTIASPIASTISTMTITTDIGNPGDGAVALNLTLYWGNFQYVCTNTPGNDTDEYSCDSNDQLSYGSQDPANPYFLKLQYDTSSVALQISMINITDVDGNWYAFDDFCIPPLMRHTMDKVISGSTSGANCSEWQSKVSYTDLAIAGDTEFTWLYVDFKIFGDRFANTANNEAGVRPPNLVAAGFTNGPQARGDPIHILIQWDVDLYTCSVIPNATDTPFECTSFSESSFCPGTQSSFFASYYFEGDFVSFNSLYFVDETNRKYSLTTLCKTTTYVNQNWVTDLFIGTGTCTVDFPGHDEVSQIWIGNQSTANANPVLIPDTIFDYPDDASHAVESEVRTGYIGENSVDYCWEQGKCAFGYGSPFGVVSCPETDRPTSDPTVEPTSVPTQEPSLEPTMEPTIEPTLEPSMDPTLTPTLIPSAGPTEDTPPPSSAPTRTPTAPPTTADPTAPPTTVDPTLSPSKFPTVSDEGVTPAPRLVDDPSIWTWIGAAIVVFCCVLLLLCLLVFWWRRRKKSDAEKEDDAPVVIPDVAAAHHEKQPTYNEFDAGAINTQPSDLNQDDDDDGLMQVAPDATEPGSPPQAADGGNNAEVELQEYRQDDAMLSQATLAGDGGTGTGMGNHQGNDAVLNMLADGHETAAGNQSAEPDAVVDEQDTFTEFKV